MIGMPRLTLDDVEHGLLTGKFVERQNL